MWSVDCEKERVGKFLFRMGGGAGGMSLSLGLGLGWVWGREPLMGMEMGMGDGDGGQMDRHSEMLSSFSTERFLPRGDLSPTQP